MLKENALERRTKTKGAKKTCDYNDCCCWSRNSATLDFVGFPLAGKL